MTKFNIKHKIWIGIKEGWNTEILPEHVIKFDNKLRIKIFKYLGSFSMFLMMSGIAKQFNNFIFYSVFLISFVYILYRLYLILYLIVRFIIIMVKGEFLVRKSLL